MTVYITDWALVASHSPAWLATTLISGCLLKTLSAPFIIPLSDPEHYLGDPNDRRGTLIGLLATTEIALAARSIQLSLAGHRTQPALEPVCGPKCG